jgi:hypothetical protein
MKRVIKMTECPDRRNQILNIIGQHTIALIQNPYGNYVIQEVFLENWEDTPSGHQCFFYPIFTQLASNIPYLSI